jgi:flagellar hook assembly protein FlgD
VSSIALAVSPNPASTTLAVEFTLPMAGHAAVEVFDVRGRRVRTLGEGTRAAGAHRFTWDGSDRRGGTVPAGIYLVRLVTDRGQTAKRVAWIANR